MDLGFETHPHVTVPAAFYLCAEIPEAPSRSEHGKDRVKEGWDICLDKLM